MEMRFFLKSKRENADGTVNMRLLPVEGAAENEEFMGAPTGELVLDSINGEAVKEMVVPRMVVTPGPKESETTKPEFPHQEYILTLTKV